MYVCMYVLIDDAWLPDHNREDSEFRVVHFHRDPVVSLGNGAHCMYVLLRAEVLHQDISGTH